MPLKNLKPGPHWTGLHAADVHLYLGCVRFMVAMKERTSLLAPSLWPTATPMPLFIGGSSGIKRTFSGHSSEYMRVTKLTARFCCTMESVMEPSSVYRSVWRS